MRSSSRTTSGRRGFTLVELLVVLALISLLASLFLPTVARARDRARTIECASNMRQLGQAVAVYVSEHRHRFPPNVYLSSPGQFWYDEDRVGGLLRRDPRQGGGIFACPNDPDALRSYAMNAWVSSALDSWVTRASPALGRLWGGAPPADAILLVESWSSTHAPSGWVAAATAGYFGTVPGARFGGGGGLTPFSAGRWGNVTSEVDFNRHGPLAGVAVTVPQAGVVNIAYADGHVESKRPTDLFVAGTTRSTLQSRWSPLDEAQNRSSSRAAGFPGP